MRAGPFLLFASPETSNKMIQKGLACRWQQSGSVARLDQAAWPCGLILPCPLHCQCGASVVTAAIVRAHPIEQPRQFAHPPIFVLAAASPPDQPPPEPP